MLKKTGVALLVYVLLAIPLIQEVSSAAPWWSQVQKLYYKNKKLKLVGNPCTSKSMCLLAAAALKQWICDQADKVVYGEESDPAMLDKIFQDAMKKWGSDCGDFKTITIPYSEGLESGYSSGPISSQDSLESSAPKEWSPSELAEKCIKWAKQKLQPPKCGDDIQQKGEECDWGDANGMSSDAPDNTYYCDSTCHLVKGASKVICPDTSGPVCPANKICCDVCGSPFPGGNPLGK